VRQKIPPSHTLQALDSFARFGSVWRAAEDLGITRSAVSHRIALLEEFLGFEILERSGKGVALTARGKRYALGVRNSLALLVDAIDEPDRSAIDGNLRISSTTGFALAWLCNHIAEFHEDYPGINVEILTRREPDDVSDGSVDVFIAFGDGNWPNYLLKKLYDVDFLPVCSPSLLNKRGGVGQPQDLLRFPLLHLYSRDDWSRWFAATGVEVEREIPGMMFSDMFLVLTATMAGQGVMMGDNVTCAGPLAAGQLVCPFSTTISAQGSYYLVIQRRKKSSAAVQAFSTWIEELIAQLRTGINRYVV